MGDCNMTSRGTFTGPAKQAESGIVGSDVLLPLVVAIAPVLGSNETPRVWNCRMTGINCALTLTWAAEPQLAGFAPTITPSYRNPSRVENTW